MKGDAVATLTRITVDVCTDCAVSTVGDPVAGALCNFPPDVRVDWGCLTCDPCGHPDCSGSFGPACDCMYGDRGHGFSKFPCDGCGSRDAGDRYPVIVTRLVECPNTFGWITDPWHTCTDACRTVA